MSGTTFALGARCYRRGHSQEVRVCLQASGLLPGSRLAEILRLLDRCERSMARKSVALVIQYTAFEMALGVCASQAVLNEENLWRMPLFAIHPEHRRRGLGRRLLLAAERQVKLRGGQELRIEVRDPFRVASSRTFLGVMGYQQTLGAGRTGDAAIWEFEKVLWTPQIRG